MNKIIITINRECGTGGGMDPEKVASFMADNIRNYGNKIITH